MSEQELKVWFFERLNGCYLVSHVDFPNDIFLYYDKKVERTSKLMKLNGVEDYLPKLVSGSCLFDIDVYNRILYCNIVEIWGVFQSEYSNDYYMINSLIDSWLVEYGISFNVKTSIVNQMLLFSASEKFDCYMSSIVSTNTNFMSNVERLKVISF